MQPHILRDDVCDHQPEADVKRELQPILSAPCGPMYGGEPGK
jgi:hypothetical protein